MALDRTWYNTLANDSGTGTDGTVWDKEDVDALMDATDAEIVRLDAAVAAVAAAGAGAVLQVVSAVTGTPASSSSSTMTDTGLTATITPSATSSKVFALAIQGGCGKDTGDTELLINLLRGTTPLLSAKGGRTGSTATLSLSNMTLAFLDSPASASAVTYKTQFSSGSNIAQVHVQAGTYQSAMFLFEIAG